MNDCAHTQFLIYVTLEILLRFLVSSELTNIDLASMLLRRQLKEQDQDFKDFSHLILLAIFKSNYVTITKKKQETAVSLSGENV